MLTIENIENFFNAVDKKEFTSSAHATSQHRIFGFITTNIRTIETLTGYIIELVPEWIKRKNDYVSWEKWFHDTDVQNKHKQKFKRLEIAKILFRNVKDSPRLNDMAEKMYRIYETYGREYLTFVMRLYLLSGHYFDMDNQPLVETNKILSSYHGDFIEDAKNAVQEKDPQSLVFAMLFYNPSASGALDIAYELLDSDVQADVVDFLRKSLKTTGSLLNDRSRIAGGFGNFKQELLVVLNYAIFKKCCEKYADSPKYDEIIVNYVDFLFDKQINELFKISDREILKRLLLDSPNKIMLKDIFEFALGIKFDNTFVRKPERKNIKQGAFERYHYKCFFDSFEEVTEEERLAHKLTYFKTRKNQFYLEGHHMVQMENSKFFEKDLDVVENIIPVCPNCHRKLHNASAEIVKKMIDIYYMHCNKNELIRKGIFVDKETLQRFYGIEGD